MPENDCRRQRSSSHPDNLEGEKRNKRQKLANDNSSDKSLVLTNLTSWWTRQNLIDFLSYRMERARFIGYHEKAILECSIDHSKGTALVELQTSAQAQNLLSLDGKLKSGSSTMTIKPVNGAKQKQTPTCEVMPATTEETEGQKRKSASKSPRAPSLAAPLNRSDVGKKSQLDSAGGRDKTSSSDQSSLGEHRSRSVTPEHRQASEKEKHDTDHSLSLNSSVALQDTAMEALAAGTCYGTRTSREIEIVLIQRGSEEAPSSTKDAMLIAFLNKEVKRTASSKNNHGRAIVAARRNPLTSRDAHCWILVAATEPLAQELLRLNGTKYKSSTLFLGSKDDPTLFETEKKITEDADQGSKDERETISTPNENEANDGLVETCMGRRISDISTPGINDEDDGCLGLAENNLTSPFQDPFSPIISSPQRAVGIVASPIRAVCGFKADCTGNDQSMRQISSPPNHKLLGKVQAVENSYAKHGKFNCINTSPTNKPVEAAPDESILVYRRRINELETKLRQRQEWHESDKRYMKKMYNRAVEKNSLLQDATERLGKEARKWKTNGAVLYRTFREACSHLETLKNKNSELTRTLSTTRLQLDEVHRSWQDQCQEISELTAQAEIQRRRLQTMTGEHHQVSQQLHLETAERRFSEKKSHDIAKPYVF